MRRPHRSSKDETVGVRPPEARASALLTESNPGFLTREGYLLGVVPQGYVRLDGEIVENPEAGSVIRAIFKQYATGQYSVRSLADYVNKKGMRPFADPTRPTTTARRRSSSLAT